MRVTVVAEAYPKSQPVCLAGLGGGSHLTQDNGEPGSTCRIGPESVGQHLTSEALCFGGQTMTATDVAVALGRRSMPGSRLPSGGNNAAFCHNQHQSFPRIPHIHSVRALSKPSSFLVFHFWA